MSNALEAYLNESKDGHMAEDKAKSIITALVNDQELIQEACSLFLSEKNTDTTCYAVGKLYDVRGESYACITMVSQDAYNIIGAEYMQDTQEQVNFWLLSSFLEFKKANAQGVWPPQEAWDSYVNYILKKNFPSLFENGIRATPVYNESVMRSELPVIVFCIYEKYSEVYG